MVKDMATFSLKNPVMNPKLLENPECSGVDVMLLDLLLWLGTVSQIKLTLLFLPTDHGLTGKACQSILCVHMFAYVPLCARWFICEHARVSL